MSTVFNPAAVLHIKRTVVQMPSDIDPMAISPNEYFGSASGIDGRFSMNAYLKNVSVVKDGSVPEKLNFSAGKFEPKKLDSLFLNRLGHLDQVGAVIPFFLALLNSNHLGSQRLFNSLGRILPKKRSPSILTRLHQIVPCLVWDAYLFVGGRNGN